MEDPANPGKMLMFKDTNFQDNLFRTPVNHDFNIDFSGGNDRGTYYLSLGYLTQEGIVVGSDYSRWSMLANGSYRLTNNLTVRSSVSYSSRKSTGVNEANAMARASLMPPTLRQYYEDGTPAPGELTSSFRTRLHEVYYQEKRNIVDRTNLMAELDWEPVQNLHIRPMFSYWSNEGRDHEFERYNEVIKNRPASANHNSDKHYQYDLVGNYSIKLWNKHNFDFMLGYNHIYEMVFRMSGSGYGGTSDYIETLNGIASESAKVNTTETYKKMSSYFGRVNYNYDMKYLLSFSLRYDGSSHFASNHKFAAFPGVSAGWNVHREHFFEPITTVVNNLKIRGSWGKTGNDSLSLDDTEGAYKAGYTYGGEAGILNTTLMNRDLLWEETTSADFGIDLGLWNNRIKLYGDVYRKVTDNRLLNEKLWSETGFSSIKSNFGSIITKGVEIAIDANAIQTRNFSWNIGASFAYFRSVIGKLPYNGADKNRTSGGIIFDEKLGKYVEVGGFAEGERFGARFAYQLDGVYATDEDAKNAPYDEGVSASWLGKGKVGGDAIWHDSDGNGIINSKDMKLVGYLNPDKMGSFNNTFRYKNLSLRIITDFSAGNVIDNKFRSQANANSRNNYATIHDVASSEMWHKQGDIATIPRYDVESDWDFGKRNHGRPGTSTIGFSGGSVNTLYIKKGDYLAFREVSLNYMLTAKWLNAAYID
ncbi:MAG: SusC/RagA family TonB-linked outer membrane protein, partial [Muribaculaceae bacterium]|nr:SusC/RagA family TonB-linked outer membrane protein [Muribaculaceae bacterium]